eukprot:scaffold22922_cov76-Amphora_coffeaeformis.AAC.1
MRREQWRCTSPNGDATDELSQVGFYLGSCRTFAFHFIDFCDFHSRLELASKEAVIVNVH